AHETLQCDQKEEGDSYEKTACRYCGKEFDTKKARQAHETLQCDEKEDDRGILAKAESLVNKFNSDTPDAGKENDGSGEMGRLV
ncbi:MAG: hypothetical protein SVS85_01850, partial [Candidatus Nanohaloarchaea archaeon]|nr:hypothetical protein [Candidatus Nanohaloarchaea archaeon]